MTFVTLLACVSARALAAPGNTVPQSLAGFRGQVTGDVCNLRSGPGTSFPVKGQALQGAWVDILDSKDGWYQVKTPNAEAWIAGWLVSVDLKAKGVLATVTKTDVNVRQGPGTDFPVLFMTQRGTAYSAQCKHGDWVGITTPVGATGWIADYLVSLEFQPPPESPPADTGLAAVPSRNAVMVTQSPVTGSATLATLNPGQSAQVLTCRGAWIAVETRNGIKGWVPGDAVRLLSPTDSSLSFGVSDTSWSIGKYPTTEVTHTYVNFRSGPGTIYGVIGMLDKGDNLRIIDVTGDWVRAVAPSGVTGYVARWLTGEPSEAGRTGFAAVADAAGPTRTLTVTGSFQSAVVVPGTGDNTVVVSTSSFFETGACLPINSFEFESIKVSASDVTLSLSEKSDYTVRVNQPGKVTLEFAPKVTRIAVQSSESHDLLTVETLGYTWPKISRNGQSLSFLLPGTTYSGANVVTQGRLIGPVNVSTDNGGTNLTISNPNNLPFLLTRAANSLEARFGTPGLSGKTVVIDPGHEDNDPGACGPTGLCERDVNWQIATRLRDMLERAGAVAVITRSGLYHRTEAPEGWNPGPDEYAGSLARRAAWSKNADVFVSIHNDHNRDRTLSGTTSYVCSNTLNQSESRRLAECVQSELPATLGTANRGIRDSELFVVRESSCPSVLVEVMYLSNPGEEQRLRQPGAWDQAASGLFKALQRFFGAASGLPPSGI